MNKLTLAMARVLITGGAGFIGHHTSLLALKSGYEVHVLDNLSSGLNGNIENIVSKGGIFHEGDVRDPETLKICMQGVDYVVHLAAQVSVSASVEHPEHTLSVNVDGTNSVISAAQYGSVKRLIFASSAAVYGDSELIPIPESAPLAPQSPYAVSKIVGEELCRRSEVESCAMRFFNVYGDGQSQVGGYSAVIPAFKYAIENGNVPKVFGDGSQVRDFIHVEDLAAIIVRALEIEHLPTEMNLASGTGTSILQLLDVLGAEEAEFMEERPGDIHTSIAEISLMKEKFPSFGIRGIEEGLS
jgi:nucleoside-diphosphate-sugar epimerase